VVSATGIIPDSISELAESIRSGSPHAEVILTDRRMNASELAELIELKRLRPEGQHDQPPRHPFGGRAHRRREGGAA
jgi:hypothetical protein